MMLGDLVGGSLRVVPMPISAPERPAGLIWHRGVERSKACFAFTDCVRADLSEIVASGLSDLIILDNIKSQKKARQPIASGAKQTISRPSCLPSSV
jgi:hypothetical protein